MREKLSSFYDGELNQSDSELLINSLKQDDKLQQQWSDYSLYGAAMRDELSPLLSTGFSEKVQKLVEDEPVQLAPASLAKRSRLRGPVVGFAVAASLLAVAILVQKPVLETSPESQVAAVAGSATTAVTTPTTVALTNATVSETVGVRPEAELQQYDLIVANSKNENVRERINRLLVEHNEYNPASDMTGIWS